MKGKKEACILLVMLIVIFMTGCKDKETEEPLVTSDSATTAVTEEKIPEESVTVTEKSIGEGMEHDLTDEDSFREITMPTESQTDDKNEIESDEDSTSGTVSTEKYPQATLPTVSGGGAFETPEQEV